VRHQARKGIVGHDAGDMPRRVGTVRSEPVRGPVQRAEKGARGDGRIVGAEDAAADAARDERAHAALVSIPFRDDPRAQAAGERVHLEMGGGTLHFVHQTEHMRLRQLAQAAGQRAVGALRGGQRGQQVVQRAVLAEEEQLVLPAEVVVEVGGGKIGRDRDLAHPRSGEAAGPEDARGGTEDLHAPGIGAS
jgi:hypothetical protein